jgi:hypothetical protein
MSRLMFAAAVVRSVPAVIMMFLAATVSGSERPSEWEPILFPIYTVQPVEGVGGIQWYAEAAGFNDLPRALTAQDFKPPR